MDCPTSIRLVVGLGNPGPEYAGTRHNAGFGVIERMLGEFKTGVEEANVCRSRCFETRFRGRVLMLQMPQTFMNLSGESVGPLMRKKQIAPEEVLLVYDDMDLPLGRLRIRQGGSAGGHHGVESVIEAMGSGDFLRLRVGIGHGRNVVDHVLSPFEGAEAELFNTVLDKAAEAAMELCRGGVRQAMNEFNAMDLAAPAAQEENKSK